MEILKYKKPLLETKLRECNAQLLVLQQECEELKLAKDTIEQYILEYETTVNINAGELLELITNKQWVGDRKDQALMLIGDASELGVNKLKSYMNSLWDSIDTLLSSKLSQYWELFLEAQRLNKLLNEI